ncbi:biotin synthase [Helicobacter mustelae]|uniref:Biotin synthase n=1 Tax=Helicobacter mustelae (strain ATCC 43772 / CCUG 25715 / CIP 103759 / LMG 18044 / NCTC 12198 / R85-136P) TaxID=679897 RepID=D3UFT6_HELM1|nr:biotin synthase [Helicobacter mustelae]CBG39357.1 putative biotin synthase [Helicobacter mustelae 12198]SQH70866.1 biotin synthase [Helicobacter mustelae]STP11994.1 biotin synthase [Helicobacter mustelae]
MKKEIFLCSISNVSSGNCPEDCAYCTQSVHYKTGVQTYKFKPIDTILSEAKKLKSYGVLGFCLVTSGRELDSDKCEYIARIAKSLIKEDLNLHLIACCGRASQESLRYLKENGIASYNHNLETAEKFFPKICSTHTWEERYETCENTLRVGLGLCSGGIFGLGESWEERMEFLEALHSLQPHTTTINFFINNKALPITQTTITKEEALECVSLAREYLPYARLMIAGGRELVFGEEQKALYESGIDAIVLGDYLTTKGHTPKRDIDKLQAYGLNIATTCH